MLIELVEKFVSEEEGRPISELTTSNSRFDRIGIKQVEDGIEIRARDSETDHVEVIEMELLEMTFQGLAAKDGTRRRDIPDDLQDALYAARYCLVDEPTLDSLGENNV